MRGASFQGTVVVMLFVIFVVCLHSIVAGMHVEVLLTLDEFVGVSCKSMRSAEVVDCCNAGDCCVM